MAGNEEPIEVEVEFKFELDKSLIVEGEEKGAVQISGDGFKRTLEDLHRDIDFGNRYRIELDKTLLALAAGVFAITVAFPPKLTLICMVWSLYLGWGALGVSMAGGFGEMHGWERYYLTYRKDFKGEIEKARNMRCRITFWRRVCRFLQIAGFLIGVAAIGYFVSVNLSNFKD